MATLVLLPTSSIGSDQVSNNGNPVIDETTITLTNIQNMDEGYDSADSTAGVRIAATGVQNGYGIVRLVPSGGSYPGDFSWANVTAINVRVRFRTVGRNDDTGDWAAFLGAVADPWATGGGNYPVGGTYPVGGSSAVASMNMVGSSAWTGVTTGNISVSGLGTTFATNIPVFMFDLVNANQVMSPDGHYGEIDAFDVVLTYTPIVSPVWLQEDYRFYDDDAAIGSVTALAAENTGITRADSTNTIVICNVGETANATQNNTGAFVWQYRVNSGSWNYVLQGSGSVRFSLSSNTTDGSNFTSKLSTLTGAATQQGTWNEFRETDTSYTFRTWTDDSAEYALCFQTVGLSTSDVVEFRLLSPNTLSVITSTNVPTLTVGTGGTQYNENHSFSGTGTSVLTKVHQYKRTGTFSGTGTSAMSRIAARLKSLAYSGTGSNALLRGVGLLKSYSGTGTSALSKTKIKLLNLAYSATGTLATTLTRTYARALAYSSTGTAALTRVASYLRSFAYSGTGTSALTKVATYLRSLTYSGTGTSVLTKAHQYVKSLAYSATGTLATLTQKVKLISGTFSGTGTAALTRSVGLLRSYAGTGTSALSKAATYVRSLAYSGTGTSVLSRVAAHLRAFTYSGTGTSVLSTLKVKLLSLAYTGTGTSALTKATTYAKSLAYSATGTFVRGGLAIGKVLTYAATGTSVLVRGGTEFFKDLTFSATGSLATAANATFAEVRAYAATGTAALSKRIGKVLSYAGTGASTVTKQVGKAFSYAATGTLGLLDSVIIFAENYAYSAAGAVTKAIQVGKGLAYAGVASYQINKAIALSKGYSATASVSLGLAYAVETIASRVWVLRRHPFRNHRR